ncbi:hypothetical protein [Paraburkholderia sp. BL27I4N3]|uniref:hypothetical protein n=1 Tax=Paraburkholderia sp. BL27I4N3 TaxID=1938805 RepID=UPI00216140E2|nr:hypothetical protein [Paraburkholderia sp. BL27I4N3]
MRFSRAARRQGVPEGIEFVEEMPIGATGRVQKQILRKRYIERFSPGAKSAQG